MAIPTALFLVLIIFTLATVSVQRTANDLRFTHLSSERTRRHYLAKAAVATSLAQLNSGQGNRVLEFDSLGDGGLVLQEQWEDHQLEVRVFKIPDSGNNLRFEGRAFPLGSPAAAMVYNSTIVKEFQNDSVLVGKTPEVLGRLLGGIHVRDEADGWRTVPPARAYEFDPAGRPHPVDPALINLLLGEEITDMPAWLLTQPAISQQGHLYAHFHTLRGMLGGRVPIYRYDLSSLQSDAGDQLSSNWKLLPPIPPREPHEPVDSILPQAHVLGEVSVDSRGRVVVARHAFSGNSVWRFTPTGEPAAGELVVPGEWRPLYRPSEIQQYREFPGQGENPAVPIPTTSNPMVLNPTTDYEGNVYALWGGEPGSLVADLLRDLSPDEETGELEIRTVEGINAIYRLPANAEGGGDWELLPPVPNMYYDESGRVVHNGNATRIGGIAVSPSGEVYAQVVRDGADTMLKYSGGGWHLLPRAQAREPDGEAGDEGDYADFNNFTVDSRGRLYGKDPNFERGQMGLDTIYRYEGGHFDTEDPITRPRLNFRLQEESSAGPQPVYRIVGGGVASDLEAYRFVPVASY